MFDTMHMPLVITLVVILLAVLAAGFFVAIRVAGARIQAHESAPRRPTTPPDRETNDGTAVYEHRG